jgi:hypothetical protein
MLGTPAAEPADDVPDGRLGVDRYGRYKHHLSRMIGPACGIRRSARVEENRPHNCFSFRCKADHSIPANRTVREIFPTNRSN